MKIWKYCAIVDGYGCPMHDVLEAEQREVEARLAIDRHAIVRGGDRVLKIGLDLGHGGEL